MLLVLKIPVVYLCAVVWWAIKAEPEPEPEPLEGTPVLPSPWPDPGCGWRRRRSPQPMRGPLPRRGRPATVPPRGALTRSRATP